MTPQHGLRTQNCEVMSSTTTLRQPSCLSGSTLSKKCPTASQALCVTCVKPLARGTSNVARRSFGKVGIVVDCLVLALCMGASGARPRPTPCRKTCQPKTSSRDHVREITSTPSKFLNTNWKMSKVATSEKCSMSVRVAANSNQKNTDLGAKSRWTQCQTNNHIKYAMYSTRLRTRLINTRC